MVLIPCSYFCLLKEYRVGISPPGSQNALHSSASLQGKRRSAASPHSSSPTFPHHLKVSFRKAGAGGWTGAWGPVPSPLSPAQPLPQ